MYVAYFHKVSSTCVWWHTFVQSWSFTWSKLTCNQVQVFRIALFASRKTSLLYVPIHFIDVGPIVNINGSLYSYHKCILAQVWPFNYYHLLSQISILNIMYMPSLSTVMYMHICTSCVSRIIKHNCMVLTINCMRFSLLRCTLSPVLYYYYISEFNGHVHEVSCVQSVLTMRVFVLSAFKIWSWIDWYKCVYTACCQLYLKHIQGQTILKFFFLSLHYYK